MFGDSGISSAGHFDFNRSHRERGSSLGYTRQRLDSGLLSDPRQQFGGGRVICVSSAKAGSVSEMRPGLLRIKPGHKGLPDPLGQWGLAHATVSYLNGYD